MTDDDFIRSLIDDPTDVGLRLVYADWLEEHGQAERAEFIRFQGFGPGMDHRRLGEILVFLGYLDDAQLQSLLEEQRRRRRGELLGEVGRALGLLTDEQVADALAVQWHCPRIDLRWMRIPAGVRERVTGSVANSYRVIPVAYSDETLTLATAEPQQVHVFDELRQILGCAVRPVVATPAEIFNARIRYYSTTGSILLET